jgi:hypothetical protein
MDQPLQELTHDTAGSAGFGRDEFTAKLGFTIDRAQRSLIAQQHAEGYWHAPLEANAEMNAEYIIFMHFMEAVDKDLAERMKKMILELQNADGSWSIFPGGEGYLSTSIEAYFALKLCGLRAGDEPMMQARRWILSKGGILAPDRDFAFSKLVLFQYVRARFVGARYRLRFDVVASDQTGGAGGLS